MNTSCFGVHRCAVICCCVYISRVPDQNGASQARYIVEIHHSSWEPSIYVVCFGVVDMLMVFRLAHVFLVCSWFVVGWVRLCCRPAHL